MLCRLLLILLLETLVFCAQDNSLITHNVTEKHFIYNTASYDTVINITVNESTTQVLDFYESSEEFLGFPSRVHVAINDSVHEDHPLFVTAAQQMGVSSWELPLVVATNHAVLVFDDMARTLCPHDSGPNITSQGRPTITLATSNPSNVSLTIMLKRVKNFYLQVNKEVPLKVTPSTPKYYYFSFDSDPWNSTLDHRNGLLPKFNYTIPKAVLLQIDSDDDVCAVVSIQNNSCPVFDNEKDILYKGYHFTMMPKGGITVTQSMFPRGFYVVFIVKESDEECTGVTQGAAVNGTQVYRGIPNGRVKNFRLKVVAAVSYSDYITGALATLGLMLLVAILAPLAAYLKFSCREEVLVLEEEAGPSTSAKPEGSSTPIVQDDTISIDSDAGSEDELHRTLPKSLNVAGLSRARHDAHRRRSDRYFWSALTVAVVYALPVVQLLFTYQRMVFQTGDQDVCYYNFLCAHPLGPLSDFNHVYSNIGYVVLGLVFMLQTRCRQLNGHRHQDLGIPQHHGLFYSMGLALVMEGVLSACYHLCPNKMNFQFDSSFMYVIAVLVMVKLYQNRHPDVNASAHATFMLIAVVMAIGLIGIMYPSIYFYVLFTILHLTVCFVLALKIYYVGRFKMERAVVPRAWSALRQQGWRAFRPHYTARAVLLAVATLANWIVAGYGLYEHKTDFARHLLVILMGNAILYTLGYVCMKLFHRERLPAPALLYLALAHAAWALAAHLFLASRTKWSVSSPAQSTATPAPALLYLALAHAAWALAAHLFLASRTKWSVSSPAQSTATPAPALLYLALAHAAWALAAHLFLASRTKWSVSSPAQSTATPAPALLYLALAHAAWALAAHLFLASRTKWSVSSPAQSTATPAPALLYLALAHAAWALAAHLFLASRTKWSTPPAVSRSHNAACSALRVLDTHDLWHLASAAAIFLSFNALLVVDDPLMRTPREEIPVF
ncbi:SID1 transmembrane family member 1-like [Epargyreus clarus]|uniref:SID1 transmembrane family member 1-like n=1 Tax=Epargyreus clarus TaxID=520877 RepID=UPI003C2BAC05